MRIERTLVNTLRGPSSSPRFLRTSLNAAASFLRLSISSAAGGQQRLRLRMGRTRRLTILSARLRLIELSRIDSLIVLPKELAIGQRKPVKLLRCELERVPEQVAFGPDDTVNWLARSRADSAHWVGFRRGLDGAIEAFRFVLLVSPSRHRCTRRAISRYLPVRLPTLGRDTPPCRIP